MFLTARECALGLLNDAGGVLVAVTILSLAILNASVKLLVPPASSVCIASFVSPAALP